MLSLRPLSTLRRTLLLLLRRRRRDSPGSIGFSPLARANRFSVSVRLTTPLSRPEMLAPGMLAAVTEEAGDGAEVFGAEVEEEREG
jgi:hypothetical protein